MLAKMEFMVLKTGLIQKMFDMILHQCFNFIVLLAMSSDFRTSVALSSWILEMGKATKCIQTSLTLFHRLLTVCLFS